MSNYYTQTSQKIELIPSHAIFALTAYKCLTDTSLDFSSESTPPAVQYPLAAYELARKVGLSEDGGYTKDNFSIPFILTPGIGGLQIQHDESIDIDKAALFVQLLFKHFDLDTYLYFDVSYSTSSDEIDGFGGGAVFITKDSITSMSTESWIGEQIRQFHESKTKEQSL